MKRVASNGLRIREKRAGMVGKGRSRGWEFEIQLSFIKGSRLHVQISTGYVLFSSSCSTFFWQYMAHTPPKSMYTRSRTSYSVCFLLKRVGDMGLWKLITLLCLAVVIPRFGLFLPGLLSHVRIVSAAKKKTGVIFTSTETGTLVLVFLTLGVGRVGDRG